MKTFQYLNFVEMSEATMNRYGADGWELVSVYVKNYHTHYVFKKEIINENETSSV